MVSDEYGGDFITVTDDDGVSFELEHLDTIEINGAVYMAFLPAQMDEDDADYGMVLLKVIDADGEDILATIDDEEELDRVYERFMEQLFGDDGEQDGEEPDLPGE